MKAAGLGPPKTEAEAAAERTAAEFAASNRAAASKSAFERVAAEKAAADKVFAERAVAAEKVAAERAAADRARAERDRAERAEREMQQASKTMRSALAALEFGQLAGSAEEREQLRAAIERARTYGVEATKVRYLVITPRAHLGRGGQESRQGGRVTPTLTQTLTLTPSPNPDT